MSLRDLKGLMRKVRDKKCSPEEQVAVRLMGLDEEIKEIWGEPPYANGSGSFSHSSIDSSGRYVGRVVGVDVGADKDQVAISVAGIMKMTH